MLLWKWMLEHQPCLHIFRTRSMNVCCQSVSQRWSRRAGKFSFGCKHVNLSFTKSVRPVQYFSFVCCSHVTNPEKTWQKLLLLISFIWLLFRFLVFNYRGIDIISCIFFLRLFDGGARFSSQYLSKFLAHSKHLFSGADFLLLLASPFLRRWLSNFWKEKWSFWISLDLVYIYIYIYGGTNCTDSTEK
jgi:hypothetical protein